MTTAELKKILRSPAVWAFVFIVTGAVFASGLPLWQAAIVVPFTAMGGYIAGRQHQKEGRP